MEIKTYSKVYTQFETQAMAFGRLKVGLKHSQHFVRGYPDYLVVYKLTEDSYNPIPVLKILVKSSSTPNEVGFFKKADNEYLLIGMDEAWKICDKVTPLL